MDHGKHPLVAIVGPTGSGKSALALRLAEVMKAEVVNCDSLQVYRYFDIGTAKATEAERGAAPHHLFDILMPDELFTAGDYSRRARQVVKEIAERGNVPVVVGGTGFYLRALLDGLFAGPARNEEVRARLEAREARRAGSLHRILRRLDAEAARRIHANDRNKLIRALEIVLVAGQPVTSLYAGGSEGLEGFAVTQIGVDPPRGELYEVLNRRCERMFEEGLLEEVKGILGRGYGANCKPFESLGYKQALQILNGEKGHKEALEEMQIQTRRYAKRQWTWFKRDSRVSWIPGFGHSGQVFDNTCEILLSGGRVEKKFFR